MADPKPHANPLFLTEEETRAGLDLLLAAASAVSRVGEGLLADRGIGRGHRRLLALIGRQPGVTLAELAASLGLPKQSASRQIAELVERTLVAVRSHPSDGRRKALRLTPAGRELDDMLWTLERREIARAYRRAGAEAVDGFKMVMGDLARIGGSAGRRPGAAGPRRRP
ncbi:MAG: MarR family transcriptional regulator [Rhodospirillaceae bacterium]|nr:MarR family transcriptional regulator [Rhodospirillaceae bacterium]MCA8933621.1 MarR family transcriptional regulator [Rhodospirillaceae bacterium]